MCEVPGPHVEVAGKGDVHFGQPTRWKAGRRGNARWTSRRAELREARRFVSPPPPIRLRELVGHDREDGGELEEIATDGLEPDLTILLDVPVEVGLAREAPADRTRFETSYDLAFHRRVRDGFLRMAVAEPGRFVVLDATAPADAIATRIERAVSRILGFTRVPSEPKRPATRIP